MENIKINLQFKDEGYGITHFVQYLEVEPLLEIEAEGFKENEGKRVHSVVLPAWEWFCKNREKIRSQLARELIKTFNDMRVKGEKHVPYETYDVILGKLPQPHRITFYKTSAFEIFYWIEFNGKKYQSYITFHTTDFAFKNAGILTMGGFKAPKQAEKPSLKTAAALYAHHLDVGNTANLYKAYVALSAKEIEAYVDLFIADKAELDDRIDCLLYLALFSAKCGPTLPDRLYTYLIENEIFYYGEIYLRADPKFADKLIAALQTVDDEEAYRLSVNHILCALAAIPCRRTNDFLIESSRQPLPIWARRLHILPRDYAHVGGWETAADGNYIRLTDKEVAPFKRCSKKNASPQSPIAPLAEVCGFCHQPLTLVFDGERPLATCLHCACYQNIYIQADEKGLHWHPKNTTDSFFQKHPEYMKNDEEITARFKYAICPSGEKRQPLWTAHQFVDISHTQFGGMPTAINDVSYPKCPDCDRTMKFVAQFDMEDVEEYGEGLYYFFACPDCRVTAANYGQS